MIKVINYRSYITYVIYIFIKFNIIYLDKIYKSIRKQQQQQNQYKVNVNDYVIS